MEVRLFSKEVEWRTQKYSLDQQFGRSMQRDKALSPEPLVAYAHNDEPLCRHQGFPVRLIVPGWYGVANVKWLSDIIAQQDPYLGKYQARWYRTVKGEMVNGEMKWLESAVTHLQLKSYVARITKEGDTHKVVGVAMNDGTAFKSVEVKVDEGAWQPATWDKQNTKDRVEAVPLRLEGRHARRAHDRVARHRRERPGAAHREGAREQEVVPRAQRAASAPGDDQLGAGGRASRHIDSGPRRRLSLAARGLYGKRFDPPRQNSSGLIFASTADPRQNRLS